MSADLANFLLAGKICFNNKWDPENSEDFHMRFPAFGMDEAKKVALERLKAFARRRLEKNGCNRFLLQKVYLSNGRGKGIALRPKYKNNGILFEKRAANVFF